MKTFGDIEVGDKLYYINLGPHGYYSYFKVVDINSENNNRIFTCQYGNKLKITSPELLNCSFLKRTYDILFSDLRFIDIKNKMEKYKRRNI